MKKVLALVAASTLLATSAMADEPVMSKFKMTIGGYVKLDYAYNSDNLGASGIITPGGGGLGAALATKTGASQQEQSILGMKQSRLFLKIDGPTFYGAKTGGLIEGDFYGNNGIAQESPQFRMRLAYGTIDWKNTSVLFGQYWDMFAPMVASTQDFRSGATTGAPNNPRSPMIKLTQRVDLNADNQLQFVVGVTDPSYYGDNTNVEASNLGGFGPTVSYGANLAYAAQMFYTTKSLGVAPGYFGLSNQPFKIGLFGQYGNEHLKAANTQTVDSWGYGAYLFAPILKSSDGKSRVMTMSFEGQVYEAANMNYNGATAASFASVGAPNTTATGGQTAAQVLAGIMPRKDLAYATQLIFYPTQDLGLTAGFGDRIAANKAADMGATVYQKYNQEIYFNAAYDLNAAVRVAAEYQNLEAGFTNMNSASTAYVAGARALASVNIGRLCVYYFF